MKKICIYFSFIFVILCSSFLLKQNNIFSNNFCDAEVQTTSYAKVLPNCTLYKSTNFDVDIDNIYFVIPETYFVMILETINEECLLVQYGNFVGYINSDFIIPATFTPNIKTLEGVTCEIKETSGTQVWSKPSANSNVLTTIPASTKKIKFIATAFGAIPSGGQSNIWYYVSYTPEYNSTNVYEGYIYSENVSNTPKIVPNTEQNPEIKSNADKIELNVSSPVKVLIISIITIPIIILLLIIFYKITKIVKLNQSRINRQNLPRIASSNSYQNINKIESYNRQNSPLHNGSRMSTFENQNLMNNDVYNEGLHQEITNIQSKPYIRKFQDSRGINNNTYPTFPTYDSDDDLL